MYCLPATQKIDMNKLKELEGESFEFEKPEVILEKYGIEVGGVPPFGFLIGLKTYYSKSINQEMSNFNSGTRTESISLKTSDLLDLVRPEVVLVD